MKRSYRISFVLMTCIHDHQYAADFMRAGRHSGPAGYR